MSMTHLIQLNIGPRIELHEMLGTSKIKLEAEKYYKKGVNNYNNKKFSAAISDLEKAVRLDPEDEEINLALGKVYYAQGEYQKAAKIRRHCSGGSF